MVKVDIYRQDGHIYKIDVYDHAGSGDYGFDLVCAGVSAVMIGALNALDSLEEDAILHMDPSPLISITLNHDKFNYLNFIYYQLKSIEESYAQYIRIMEKEEVR